MRKLPVAGIASFPKDASEVRSFMGLIQFSSKFLPDVGSCGQTYLRANKKGTNLVSGENFVSGENQQKAFENQKQVIMQADTQAYYKVGYKTYIKLHMLHQLVWALRLSYK